MTSITRKAAALLALVALANCGGGGSGSGNPLPAPQPTGASGTASIAVTLKVPGTPAGSARRSPSYTSRSTRGMGFDWHVDPYSFPRTDTALASPKLAVAIAPNTTYCGAAQADGSFTCTITVPGVPVGYIDILITAWDGAPASGSTPFAGADMLSMSLYQPEIIEKNQPNQLYLSLNPVVSSLVLNISPPTLSSGTATTATLSLLAKDAQGNVIIGNDPWVDAHGNALSVTVAATDPASAVSVDPTTFYNSGNNTRTVTYTGAAETSGCKCAQFTATPSAYISGTNVGTKISFTNSNGGVTVPGVPQITDAITLSSRPTSIASAPGGALYVSEVNGHLARLTSGHPMTLTSEQPTSFMPQGLVFGPDNYLWFYDATSSTIVRMNVGNGAHAQSAAVPAAQTPLVSGPDAHVWFATATTLDSVDPASMTVTAYALTGLQPNAIATGPVFGGHNTVCVSEAGPSAVACLDLTTHTYISGFGQGTPTALATGADGQLYAAMLLPWDYTEVQTLVENGVILQPADTFTQMVSQGNLIDSMVSGPDGNIWYSATSGPTAFGYADECACQFVEYGPQSGVPAGTTPGQIVIGNDRRPYFIDTTNNAVDRIGQ